MHSTSNATCSDRTSAAERGSVIAGSGRAQAARAKPPPQAVHNGTQRVTAMHRPEPFRSPQPPDMARWAGAKPRWAVTAISGGRRGKPPPRANPRTRGRRSPRGHQRGRRRSPQHARPRRPPRRGSPSPVIERDDERPSGSPDGSVVGEVDHPGIELLEGINPVRDVGQGRAVSITMGSPRELVGRVLRCRIVALPRHDHRPVRSADDQRLVTVGVTWRRHEEDPRQHLSLACHSFEATALDEFRERVVLRLAGGIELDFLNEDRDLAQHRVAAAVVEVQVAVRGKPDVRDLRPGGRQRLAQLDSAGPVAGVNRGMGAHAGVEQDHSSGVADDVAQARFHSGTARPGLLRWPHEVAEINAPHRDVSHSAILADPPRGIMRPARPAGRRSHRASAITSSRPAWRSSASPPGSVIAAVSVLTPMQHCSLCEIRVIIAAQPGSGPNGYMCVIRDPATYNGYGTPGMLETWTSLVLVSRPETAAMANAGSQPSAGASAPDTASAAVTLAVRAVSTYCRTAAILAAGSGSAMGAAKPAPVKRLPPCGSSWVRRLIGNPTVSLSTGAPCRSW